MSIAWVKRNQIRYKNVAPQQLIRQSRLFAAVDIRPMRIFAGKSAHKCRGALASFLIPGQPTPHMRRMHRTLVARCFAALLLCLAASPVTAPFTTCDLADFFQHHPSSAPHAGHQIALPGAKGASTPNSTTLFDIPAASHPLLETPYQPIRSGMTQRDTFALRTVLRI